MNNCWNINKLGSKLCYFTSDPHNPPSIEEGASIKREKMDYNGINNDNECGRTRNERQTTWMVETGGTLRNELENLGWIVSDKINQQRNNIRQDQNVIESRYHSVDGGCANCIKYHGCTPTLL